MGVSVVIPAYNAERTIFACLSSVCAQVSLDELDEVIVVDDASIDKTVSIIQQYFPSVRLIEKRENTGVADTRNVGMRAARGDSIAFTDADCVVDPDWLSVLKRAVETYTVVAGTVCHYKTFVGMIISIVNFGEFSSDYAKYSNNVCGNNFAFQRCAAEGVEFHASLCRCGEDRLFAWHLTKKGYQIRYCPQMRISHDPVYGYAYIFSSAFSYGKFSVLSRSVDPTLPGGGLLAFPFLLPFVYPMVRYIRDVGYVWEARSRFGVMLFFLPVLLFVVFVVRVIYAVGCGAGVFQHLYKRRERCK